MRIWVDISPHSDRMLAPGKRRPHPRHAEPIAPCIAHECRQPFGGALHRDATDPAHPRRVHGFCLRCYRRRDRRDWRSACAAARARRRAPLPHAAPVLRPCADPRCPNPLGGYIPKDQRRPVRRNGFCQSCFNRRARAWQRVLLAPLNNGGWR